jgi:hypothetical protein
LERKQTHVKKRLAELREQVRRQEEEERKARVSRLNPGKRSAISARMNQRRAETGEFISGQMRRNTP